MEARTVFNCEDLYCYEYNTSVTVDAKGVRSTIRSPLEIRSDVVTKEVIRVNNHVFESSYGNRMIRGDGTQSLFLSEFDSMGRESTKTMIIRGEVAIHEAKTYGKGGLLAGKRATFHGTKATRKYKYSKQGNMLEVQKDNRLTWTNYYDEDGHMINIDFGPGNTDVVLEHGVRISKIAGAYPVEYDYRGFMLARHNYTFEYNDQGQLLGMSRNGRKLVEYLYDDYGRVILQVRKLTRGRSELLSYFYGYKSKERLVSHVHSTTRGFWTLEYDAFDRLLAVTEDETGETLYVSTEDNGTPEYVFNADGEKVNSYVRSPWGAVIGEDDERVWLPLGFHGGIEDSVSGIVVIDGEPYDSHLGQWMTPRWRSLLDGFRDHTAVHVYRFRNNDPVNPDSLRRLPEMNTVEDWLALYGIKSPREHLSCLEEDDDDPDLDVFASLSVEQDVRFDSPSSTPRLFKSFSSEPQLLGPNVVLNMNPETKEVAAKFLRGAGTLEQDLTHVVHNTFLLGIDPRKPSRLNFFSPPYKNLPDLTLLEKNLRTEKTFFDESKFVLELDMERFQMRFWVGFQTVREIEQIQGRT